MPDFVLRRAAPNEADAVCDLVRCAYAKWVPVIGREPMPMRADYAAAIKDHLVFVHESSGSITVVCELELRPDHLFIVNLAVAPELQGQGIGRQLLRHAEDVARMNGFGEIRLLTNEMMATNRAFYRRHGYEEYDIMPFEGGGHTVHMRKRL